MVNVLIVEDDPTAQKAYQFCLERVGYNTRCACDAEAAIALAATWTPDVLLCDWQLGGSLNGTDVARAISRQHSSAVVFVTSHPLESLKAQARDLDVKLFLHKPISADVLRDAVRIASA